MKTPDEKDLGTEQNKKDKKPVKLGDRLRQSFAGSLRTARKKDVAASEQTKESGVRDGRWRILWNEFGAYTYLYGARVQFHSRTDVEYEDPLLPPGTVIRQWMSKTNFQRDQIEPSLPLIDGERSYRVHLEADTDVEAGLLLRFSFYQKNGTPEGAYVMRGTDGTFRCPIRTNDYTAELIAAGAHHFHFHYFLMEELPEKPKVKKDTETDVQAGRRKRKDRGRRKRQ